MPSHPTGLFGIQVWRDYSGFATIQLKHEPNGSSMSIAVLSPTDSQFPVRQHREESFTRRAARLPD